MDVNSVESDNGNFNFLARLTFFDVGKNGDEWRNDVRLGANIAIFSEYYRPLGRSKFFVAPRVLYERRRINLFNDITRVAEYVGQTSQAGIDLGYAYDARSELRAGYTIGYQKVTRRIGDPLFANQRGRFSTAGLHWSYDSLDRSQVPTHGVLSKNNLNYYFTAPGASSHFSQAETRSMAFGTYGERNIVFAFGGGGTTFGATAPTMQQFTLGGPFRLGGYGYEQFRGSNYLQGGAGFLHNPKIFPSLLGAKAYLGLWYEGGSVFEKIANASYRQSVSGGAIVETPVGPLFVGGSVNENGRGRFYFSFGRVFR